MGMMPPGSHGPVIWWGGWGRGRRNPESGPANSGLTGDPTIEPPQQPEGPKDLRGRWESLKQSVVGTTAALPQVLRLVWEASRPTTIGLFLTTALAGVIPTISVGITLTLTNAVVAGIAIHQFHLPDRIVFSSLGVAWLPGPTLSSVQMIVLLAALQFVLFVISVLLNTLRNIFPQLVKTYSFAKEVKLFGLGQYFVDRYRLIANAFYDSQKSQLVRRYMTGFVLGNLSTIVTSITYLYIALQAIAGRMSLGSLTAYTQAAVQVQNSIQSVLSGFSGMYEHNLYLNNLVELMARQPSMPVAAEPKPVPQPLRGEIRFEHVSFAYPGAEKNALTDLTFTVTAGETLAVVGRNGAGKTTLFKLICRLYDPNEGRILIDGVDIRDFEPSELRRQIGAMFQDYVDYQATASENIGLGNVPEIADRDAVVSASKQAGSDELIANLPAGYDTALGKWFDAGVNLSGGEWQKVALARAFMREDARILLLDEPTSALDAQAEYDLFERLRSLTHGRTAVYISHRFSTVRRADRIIFLEHGRLVEEGTHEALIQLNGRYARLFRMQAAAYTGEDIEIIPEEAVSN